jgi:hydrogenase maturation protease
MLILVAGVGNLLRGDDGFGVEVARALMSRSLPPGVRVVETGIGGIHLVQEMLIIDAVDLGHPPGKVLVVEPEVIDVHALAPMERFDALADMHYTKPARAFMLAKALGVLPERFLMVGCQPVDADRLGEGLSPRVAAAVPVAVAEVERIVAQWLAEQEVVLG